MLSEERLSDLEIFSNTKQNSKHILGTNQRAHEGHGEKPRVETKTVLILSL
jgi:hypothetical protein